MKNAISIVEDSFIAIENEYAVKNIKNLVFFCVAKKSMNVQIDRAQNKFELLSARALLPIAIINGADDINNVNRYETSSPKNFLEK